MKFLLLALAVAFDVGAYAVLKFISAKPHDLLWTVLFASGFTD